MQNTLLYFMSELCTTNKLAFPTEDQTAGLVGFTRSKKDLKILEVWHSWATVEGTFTGQITESDPDLKRQWKMSMFLFAIEQDKGRH